MNTPLRLSLGFAAIIMSTVTPCRGAEPWPLWHAYTAAFYETGRIVDHQSDDRTTSEGQAYALFFALVADDRTRFDELLNWTQQHLAAGSLKDNLPAWAWGRSQNGTWELLDANSASDADLWIAYTLLEAGRLWQEPPFSALGKSLLAHIAQHEVATLPGLGPMLLPGPRGFHPSSTTWLLNPSYLPLPVLTRLAHIEPSGPWSAIATSLPKVLAQGSPNGFAMDWVAYDTQNGISPSAISGIGPVGSYDAIRVYLWAGMTDAQTPGIAKTFAALLGMEQRLTKRSSPPEKTNASQDGPIGFSAALMPYLEALGKEDLLHSQQIDLHKRIDHPSGLYGRPPTYYDQNLAMFGEGWLQRRFRFGKSGELYVDWQQTAMQKAGRSY